MSKHKDINNNASRDDIGSNALGPLTQNASAQMPSHPNIGLNAATQPLTRSASGWHPKVFIKTFGCQMNSRDSEALSGLFVDRGYRIVEKADDADVILVNTCSVRAHAENRAISFLGSLKSIQNSKFKIKNCQSPKVIGLIGCMARNLGEEIYKKMPHVNLICGPGCLDKIPDYIKKVSEKGSRIIDLEDRDRNEELYSLSFKVDSDRAGVVISTGCSNYCSYCVVPYVRGNLRPRNHQNIVDEVKNNIKAGVGKITLLGQNVNDYHYQFKIQNSKLKIITFVDLLKMISDLEGLKEVDFISSNPRNSSVELFKLMAERSNIKKHLHIPFQSGSDRVLKSMNRGYAIADYLDTIKKYKEIVGGSLSADIIVGFPNEEEDDFLATKSVVEKVEFKYAYIFKYSPRLGTAAANMVDSVSTEYKEKRHKELLDLQKQISRKLQKKC
ncbi:MAG: MiaB/RimO family radical SAM methylthiotransferase [Candidatus Omnitrophica bacterium]|nr:MiaB/RimO family radical SAM methylthiotransferase [Candidatus Omnitrophota bacterium]